MENEIEEFIKDVFIELNYDLKYLCVEESNRKDLADFQINSVFNIAKEIGKSPVEIGNLIVDKVNLLNGFNNYFDSFTFYNPGFINIRVSNRFINKYLNILLNDSNLGVKKIDIKELYFLDYGGANIAKPLHIGHLRPAIIGESLKRILNFKGYNTISDVHFGDFGLQIGLVIYGIKKEGIKEITLDYLDYIYPKMSKLSKEDEEVLKEAKQIVRELQDGKEEYVKLWKIICEVSIKEIKRIYKFLEVDFDLWLSESDSNKYIPELFRYLEEKNIMENSEGAKVIRVEESNDSKNMPPLLLEASNGAYLYATTDLATIYERVKKYNIDHILYVVDLRQSLHFEQLFRAAHKSDLININKLEHISFGTINDPDGKPFKTRSGDALKLVDLFTMVKDVFISKKEENKNMSEEDIDKIVNAIIKYADLQNNREKNYIFDVSKFSDVNGKTGPYLLYTALRIKKLLKEYSFKENITDNIYNDKDRELRIKLLELDSYVEKSIKNRCPHFIAEYLYELSNIANNFYQNNNISNLKDETKKNEWLTILNITFKILEKCLYLLIIDIPSSM